MSYNNNKNKNRYIIVEFYSGEQIKIFNDKTPKKAANQAFSYLLQFMNVNESQEDFLLGKFLVFIIKNLDTDKEYKYIGNRIKLENPVKVNGITYQYKNVIGKYKPVLDLI